jgi:hypothetical protein
MTKLYTEEQVNRIANQVRINGFWNSQDFIPIELPTDEEIYKESDNYLYGFSDGAKWMRDKIKGVVNEKEVL